MPDKPPPDTKSSGSVSPYNEEESARRLRNARRQARAAADETEHGGKRPGSGKSGPAKGPEKYRGVAYSVAPHGEGQWIWKLRARGEDGAPAPSGTVRGRQNDAIEAAHRAIDKTLGSTRK